MEERQQLVMLLEKIRTRLSELAGLSASSGAFRLRDCV